MKKFNNVKIIWAVLGLLLVISLAGWIFISSPKLIIQGEIESTEVKSASKLTGRIIELYVKEGEYVKAGQKLATLSSPEVEAKLEQALAAKEAAGAKRSKAERGTRKEKIQSAKNVWLKAKAGADLARKTFARIQKVYDEGVVPAQKLDEASAKMIAAIQTEKAAKASYDMAISGARDEDRIAASALESKAAGGVKEVEVYMKERDITSPINGEVASIIAEKGELVPRGYPVITLVDLEDCWVTFNLREDLLKDIKMGKTIKGIIPAIDSNKEFSFKINYITARGTYAAWSATKTRGDFDLKTFEIRAIPETKVEGLRPGMSVLVDWSQFSI